MDARALWNDTTAPRGSGTVTTCFIFNCAVLTLTLVLGSPGNLWVCWVVFRTRSLQTSNNALLVSLAASDLLKCSVDTPLLLCSLLRSGRGGRVPVSVCALQQFTYALCSCVQLLTLLSISVERFQAVAFPFQADRRRARVRLWILSIWGCGAVLALVSLCLSEKALFYMLCRPHLGAHGDPHLGAHEDGDQHPGAHGDPRLPYSDPFGPFVLVPLWGLSLAVIVVHYVRIFKIVRRHRKVFIRGVQGVQGVQLRPTVSEQVSGWLSVPAPPGSFGPPPRRTVLLVAEAGAPRGGGPPPPRSRPPVVGPVCLLTPGARARGREQVEGRLAQRFGYIIIASTLLWVPLVVVLLLDVLSWDSLLMELETSAVVLTCVQAAVDPLIYTLVTRQFRSELGKILSSVPRCPLKRRT